MFTIGTRTFTSVEGGEGSGIFVALMSPLVVVSTTYFAYKKGLDQLARFVQVGGVMLPGWYAWMVAWE